MAGASESILVSAVSNAREYVVPKSEKSNCSVFSVNEFKYGINFGGQFNVKSADEATQIFEKMLFTIEFAVPQSIVEAKQNPYIEVLQPERRLKEGDDYSLSASRRSNLVFISKTWRSRWRIWPAVPECR
jgi:hypothetical protein